MYVYAHLHWRMYTICCMINDVGPFHVRCNIVLLSENFVMRILVLFM